MRSESPGQKDERDDHQANERTDDEAEEKRESVFAAANVLNQFSDPPSEYMNRASGSFS